MRRIRYQLVASLASWISFSWNLFGCPRLLVLLCFFFSSFYYWSCAQIYQLLCLLRTPGSCLLFITATPIPLLWPKLWQLHGEKEGEVVYFHRNCPQLPRMPWGSTRDSGKGVSRKPSYHVQWGAAFQEQPPSCTMPPPRPQVPGNVSHSSNMGRFKNLPQRNRHSLFQWAICKKEDWFSTHHNYFLCF